MMSEEVPLSIWTVTLVVPGEDGSGVIPMKAADVPKLSSAEAM